MKTRKNFAHSALDILTFGSEVRQLVEIINTAQDAPSTATIRPISHPAGFSSLIGRRRLTIAEAYIRLLSYCDSTGYAERIESLQALMYYVRYSKKSDMPANAARVQIALLKKAVKMRGNLQIQHELMSDFVQASRGKSRFVRKLLRELGLIEVSELKEDVGEQTLAWDDHVHEPLTVAHHAPTLLLLDAYVKGISRVTTSYYDLSNRARIEELFLAGKTLGIRCQAGIRFSVGKAGQRRHYMFLPNTPDFWEFFESNKERLEPFMRGIEKNAQRRAVGIQNLVDEFNRRFLPEINADFEDLEVLRMAPIVWEDVKNMIRNGQISRNQLGVIICHALSPIAHRRALYLKNEVIMHADNPELFAKYQALYEKYDQFYRDLSPTFCIQHYVCTVQEVDYDSVFEHESEILPILNATGGYVSVIRVLRTDMSLVLQSIIENVHYITDIEVYNLFDFERFGGASYEILSNLILAFRAGDVEAVEAILRDNGVPHTHDQVQDACDFLRKRPFYTRCSSDSAGWYSQIPGMGFFHEFQLDTDAFRHVRKQVQTPILECSSRLLDAHRSENENKEKMRVFLLSSLQKQGELSTTRLEQSRTMTPTLIWRYLNVDVRCVIKIGIGIIPAWLCLGPFFAVLWFVITSFRNVIVDFISSAGVGPKNWKIHSIDRDNLCTCLFFTGFSVPIMSAAKYAFDLLWLDTLQLGDGFLFTFIKFWVIALANGCYLAAHNTLRGFELAAIRGNFFRSVLSWPLATAASYVLTPLGVPDVVQAKLASEVVAGIIEGSVKYRKNKKLAVRALLEVYRQITSPNRINALMARLDILYFWSHYSFGKATLDRLMNAPETLEHWDENRRQTIEKGNHLIVEKFSEPRSLEEITYAIIQYYSEENLEVLTELAGSSHRPFVDWMRAKHCALSGQS